MAKKTYRVADGVATINGAPVGDDRTVELDDAQALYDLALGRISQPPPRRAARKKAGQGDGTGNDRDLSATHDGEG